MKSCTHGTRARVRTSTAPAPAARSARAAASAVAPVVSTSSTRRSVVPRKQRGKRARYADTTFVLRAAADNPACGGRSFVFLSTRARSGTRASRATARATSSAWLKPRSRLRPRESGTGITAEAPWSSPEATHERPARRPRTDAIRRRPPYFSACRQRRMSSRYGDAARARRKYRGRSRQGPQRPGSTPSA